MVGGEFKRSLSERTRLNDSRLILALDVAERDVRTEGLEQKYLKILDDVSSSISAVKAGYPLVLSFGLEIISKIKRANDVPVIADFKIADVPHINRQIARRAFEAEADGVIAHAFVGRDSLEAIVQVAEEEDGRGLIVVPTMTHEGGETFIQPLSNRMLELASEVEATGIIGPATRPEDVTALRARVGEDMLILTPGIGAQGAQPGDAVRCGADYEIVGRSIYASKAPAKTAEEIRNRINETIEEEDRC